MQDRTSNRTVALMPADQREQATAEALGARVLERAKAPRIVPFARPKRAGDRQPDFRTVDRLSRALLARATQGVSPNALVQTWTDWAVHLAQAPGKRAELAESAAMSAARLALWLPNAFADGRHAPPFAPLPTDRRFRDPGWAQWPFNVFVQNFLGAEAWWAEATRDVPGLVRDREAEVAFMTRAAIDMISPSNVPWLNPVSIAKTVKEGGLNLVRGAGNWLEDLRPCAGWPPSGRRGKIRGRARRGGHARQGRVPQRPDGIDPVRADNGQGFGRADPDHPGLDHEVLYPRPRAEELARALARRARAHRLHGVVEESGRARSRSRPRRLPAPRGARPRWTRSRRSFPTRRSMPAAIASAARSSRSPPRRWRATATTGSRASRCSPPRPTSPRPARSCCSSTRGR